MTKIKFFRDKALPQNITNAHDGVWIVKPDNSTLMRIYVIYDGVIINDDSVDIATFIQALSLKANDDEVVKILGNQIIKGLKVYEIAPKIQVDAIADEDSVRKRQLDVAVSQITSNIENLETLVVNLLRPIQEIDCSDDPDYPASLSGDRYLVTEAGKIGGINGEEVNKGDLIVARYDTSGGPEDVAGNDFFIIRSVFDIGNFLDTFVRYDIPQGLSPTEQETARNNINAVGAGEAVLIEGNQLVEGNKEFLNPIKVPDAVNNDEAVNKGQLDNITTYLADSPSTVKVGNWDVGTVIYGKSFEEMLENIYTPYQTPEFNSFYISGFPQDSTSLIEVGTNVGGLSTFIWSYKHAENIKSGNVILIEDITAGTTITNPALSKSNTSYTTNLPSVTLNTEGERKWRISGTDTKENSFYRDYNMRWQYALFMGSVATVPTTGTQVRSMLTPRVENKNTFEFNTGVVNKDFIIAIPNDKEVNRITVLNTSEDVTLDFEDTGITTVPHAGGGAPTYKVLLLSMDTPFSEDYTIKLELQ